MRQQKRVRKRKERRETALATRGRLMVAQKWINIRNSLSVWLLQRSKKVPGAKGKKGIC